MLGAATAAARFSYVSQVAAATTSDVIKRRHSSTVPTPHPLPEHVAPEEEKKEDLSSIYQTDPYNLSTIDGLINRKAELKTFNDRIEKLGLYHLRCTNPDCTCVFEEENYYFEKRPYKIREWRSREERPLTWFRHADQPVYCRLCGFCLYCHPENPTPALRMRHHIDDPMACPKFPHTELSEEELTRIPLPKTTTVYPHPRSKIDILTEQRKRIIRHRICVRRARCCIRNLWFWGTAWGLLIWLYNLLMDRLEIAVLALLLSLWVNFDDKLTIWGFATPETAQPFSVQFQTWMQSFSVILIIIVATRVLKIIEWINFVAYTPHTVQLKQERFRTIEEETTLHYRFHPSYYWQYYPRCKVQGKDDPDVAYLNFNEPPDARRWNQIKRTFFFVM
jgi:hypothetical protein